MLLEVQLGCELFDGMPQVIRTPKTVATLAELIMAIHSGVDGARISSLIFAIKRGPLAILSVPPISL